LQAKRLKKAKIMSIGEIGKFPPNSFDTVLMLGNNFGLFGSPEKAEELPKKRILSTMNLTGKGEECRAS